jgi:hypothetical protein
MAGDLTLVADTIGVSVVILAILLIWEMAWKLTALWRAARQNQLVWFIVLALTSTIGILPILYLFVFSKLGKRTQKEKAVTVRKKKRRR